jgi:hypothetical protein
MLAASLGWNVIQKINNPIALVSRDGTQRRLPTNTSVRMSVFQSALSQIMVHTEGWEATPELIDAIVKETKVDRDHERRLRLAIGESPAEHKARLANERAAEQKRVPDEHLTQTPPEITGMGLPEELVSFEPPADGQKHGALMSREPFMAHHQTGRGRTHIYESDSSYERVWQDGYKDYECRICGKVFRAAKGAGSHRQVHLKSGEIPRSDKAAWQRAATVEVPIGDWEKHPRRTKAEVAAEVIPVVEDLVFEDLPPVAPPAVFNDEGKWETLQVEVTTETADAEEIIDRIAEMVAPRIMASRDSWKDVAKQLTEELRLVQQELGDKTAELEKLRADWDALRGLIDGR